MSSPYGEFMIEDLPGPESGQWDWELRWDIPAGVEELHIVIIGEGGANSKSAHHSNSSKYNQGGGGGGLAWANRVPITSESGVKKDHLFIRNNFFQEFMETDSAGSPQIRPPHERGLRIHFPGTGYPVLQAFHGSIYVDGYPSARGYGGSAYINPKGWNKFIHQPKGESGAHPGGNSGHRQGMGPLLEGESPEWHNLSRYSGSGAGGAGGYSGPGGDGGQGAMPNQDLVKGFDGVQGGGGGAAAFTRDNCNNFGAGGGTTPYGTVWGQGQLDEMGRPNDGKGGIYTNHPNGDRDYSYGRNFGSPPPTVSWRRDGGVYGGGAKADSKSSFQGGKSVVRIIWGEDRAFPGTNVGPDYNYGPPIFLPNDIFLVNKNGNSYKVKYENLRDVAGTILVSRGGASRKVNLATNSQSIRPDDMVLVNRGGKSYKAAAGQIKGLFE